MVAFGKLYSITVQQICIAMTPLYILTGGFLVLVAALYLIFRRIRSVDNYRYQDYGPVTDPMPDAPTDEEVADYTNKYCTRLEDFVIDESINDYDLQKLAVLNGIKLQISRAWYPLVLDLIRELDQLGWDRKVSCIKEKYASLRFYTAHQYNEVIEKYTERSEKVCETCGEKGMIRYHGWEYVACRKHYLQARGLVTLLPEGFTYNGKTFFWSQVAVMNFGDKNHMGTYRHLEIHLEKKQFPKLQPSDLSVRIYNSVVGYGALLHHLPLHMPGLDYDWIDQFRRVSYCDICGYEAVYRNSCECCENDTRCLLDPDENHRHRAILYGQLEWLTDEGEYYESLQPHYRKNPDHKIIYTQQDIDDWE